MVKAAMHPLTAPRRPSAAADACAIRLVDIAPLAVRFVRAQMRRRMPELTMAQFRAMSFVYRRGGRSLRALADHLGVTPPTCSALVDRLVARGVLTRVPSPTSRREVALHLTRAGRAQFEAAKDAARDRTADVLASLPDATLRRLTQDLDALAAAFASAEVNPDR